MSNRGIPATKRIRGRCPHASPNRLEARSSVDRFMTNVRDLKESFHPWEERLYSRRGEQGQSRVLWEGAKGDGGCVHRNGGWRLQSLPKKGGLGGEEKEEKGRGSLFLEPKAGRELRTLKL